MPPNPKPLPKLRALRERAALSQRDLAERSGVGKTTILKLERGRQRAYPATIRRLAEALGATPDDLGEGTALARPPDLRAAASIPATEPGVGYPGGRYPKRHWTRAEIEEDLARMATDREYQAEALALEAEYVLAGWEALQTGEWQPDDEDAEGCR